MSSCESYIRELLYNQTSIARQIMGQCMTKPCDNLWRMGILPFSDVQRGVYLTVPLLVFADVVIFVSLKFMCWLGILVKNSRPPPKKNLHAYTENYEIFWPNVLSSDYLIITHFTDYQACHTAESSNGTSK